jgi:catechol 2,3-dioxygenase-like lactoylglutathione lyase family enzyme
MKQKLGQIALLVRDYDEAIAFYTEKLGFELVEDSVQSPTKRWVVVRPPGSDCALLLAKAANERQAERLGDQTGGRVFLFLYTGDFQSDYDRYKSQGVKFVREPSIEAYGKVAVFEDLYGNLWDLIQRHDDKG